MIAKIRDDVKAQDSLMVKEYLAKKTSYVIGFLLRALPHKCSGRLSKLRLSPLIP